MPDVVYKDQSGVRRPDVKFKDLGDNTYAEVVTAASASNITTKFRDAFEEYVPNGNRWVETLASGDIIMLDGNAAAASYLVISKSPLHAGTESSIESRLRFTMPVELSVGLHMSQRTLGQEASLEVVDDGVELPPVPDLEIVAVTQATTTLTVTTAQPHGLSVGKSIGIRGVLDSRLNYPSLVVASVPALNQFTCTAGPGGTIASLSAYTTSVLAATTAALPANTYANGASGVGATLTATANGAFPDQDGVTIPLGGRLLVKNEAAPANNGLFVLTQVGSASLPWILTRATDFDTTAEMTVTAGALFAVSVFVAGGTTQAQKEFYLAATVTTVGTTAVTFTDSGAPPAPLGFVYFRERLGRARNGVSEMWEMTTATTASLYIRSESGDALPSGTIAGAHGVTVGTTASVQLVNAAYQYAFAPTVEQRIVVQADRTQWSDGAVDSTAQSSSRLVRTQVCPDPSETYKLRIRATNNKALTVPNAQVISVTKSGSTTGTFTTDGPHGLFTGDVVVYYGSSDNAAATFPSLVAATAITVTGANTFTAVIGTGTTGTAYGGFVARVQGGYLLSGLGALTQTAINATLTTLADGTRQLVLTGNGTWGGVVIGDLVNVIGARSVPGLGTSLGIDGAWKVANLATAALTLVSLPGQTWPADFATTTCGGAVIRRTDVRISFVRVFDFERLRIEALTRPGSDPSAAMPVAVQGGSVAVSSAAVAGTVAIDAAIGNPVTAGLRASNANIAAMSATGDNVAWLGTMIGVGVVKPYSLPEADWATPAPVGGIVNTTASFQVRESAGAGLRNYVTAIDLVSEALTNATDLRLREADLTAASQTIASNTLTTGTHGLSVGDAVVFTASTVTGITVGVTYFVLTVPAATTMTLSATRGGSTLAISGTSVTATLHRVLWQTRIPTTGSPPRQILFPTPLRGATASVLQLQTATASGAGAVWANVQGYSAP